MLLDIDVLSDDILVLVIKVLCWVIGGLVTIGGVVANIMYKGMIKRFDNIDTELNPIVKQVTANQIDIINIKEEQHEINRWLGNHDGRIQTLERITGHLN